MFQWPATKHRVKESEEHAVSEFDLPEPSSESVRAALLRRLIVRRACRIDGLRSIIR